MKKLSIKIKDLKSYVDRGRVFIDTPEGRKQITNTYIKTGMGIEHQFDDGSKIKCKNDHLILSDNNQWTHSSKFSVGDVIKGKTIVSSSPVSEQTWYDFTVDSESQSYCLNGLIHHNSGKSLIQYLLAFYAIKSGWCKKILIVVPTVMLVDQLAENFNEYGENDPDWNPEWIHKIYGGQEKESDCPIVISTWQSIFKQDESYFIDFDGILVDECLSDNTEILTPTGLKKICDVSVGDEVINFDEKNNTFKTDIVVKQHKNLASSQIEKMYSLSFDNGKVIEVTGNHKFLTTVGWIRADELSSEHEIINTYDHSRVINHEKNKS